MENDSVVGIGCHCTVCGHDWGIVLHGNEKGPTHCPKCGAPWEKAVEPIVAGKTTDQKTPISDDFYMLTVRCTNCRPDGKPWQIRIPKGHLWQNYDRMGGDVAGYGPPYTKGKDQPYQHGEHFVKIDCPYCCAGTVRRADTSLNIVVADKMTSQDDDCLYCGMPAEIKHEALKHLVEMTVPGEDIPRPAFLAIGVGEVTAKDVEWVKQQLGK